MPPSCTRVGVESVAPLASVTLLLIVKEPVPVVARSLVAPSENALLASSTLVAVSAVRSPAQVWPPEPPRRRRGPAGAGVRASSSSGVCTVVVPAALLTSVPVAPMINGVVVRPLLQLNVVPESVSVALTVQLGSAPLLPLPSRQMAPALSAPLPGSATSTPSWSVHWLAVVL